MDPMFDNFTDHESSGTEYNVQSDEDVTSSSSQEDISVKTVKRRLPPKRTSVSSKRTRLEPAARSTPKDGVYAFADEEHNEDAENQLTKNRDHFAGRQRETVDTPTTWQLNRAQKTDQVDLRCELAAMRDQFGKAVDELRKENKELRKANQELRKANQEQRKQIAALDDRLKAIETSSYKSRTQGNMKTSNNIRAAIREGLKHAENEKGLQLDLHESIDSTSNHRVSQHVYKFAKTHIQDLAPEDFKAGMRRIARSKKEKSSRQKKGAVEKHRTTVRKQQRKQQKSRTRLQGIEKATIDRSLKQKYAKALKHIELQSSEESMVDEEGTRCFVVRPRQWESQELKTAKATADKAYQSEKATSSAHYPRTRRTIGAPSLSLPPCRLNGDEDWTVVSYGVL